MVVRTGLGVRVDGDRPGPEFGGPGPFRGNRGASLHAERLRGGSIEFIRTDDAHSVRAPTAGRRRADAHGAAVPESFACRLPRAKFQVASATDISPSLPFSMSNRFPP